MEVDVRADEDLESALRRFRRKIQQAGVLREIRRRRFYEKPSDERRRLEKAAARKRR